MSNDPIMQSIRDKIYSALDALSDGQRRTAAMLLERAAAMIRQDLQPPDRIERRHT